MSALHIPVLLKEVIDYLDPQPGQNFIDCTFGQGGHAAEILKKIAPNGKILALDANPEMKKFVDKIGGQRIIFINDNFVNLKKIYESNFFGAVNGILFDLGLSSSLIEDSGRGFSFRRSEPLDMRFDPEKQSTTAADVLNNYQEKNLDKVFRELGEIYFARRLAREVVATRRRRKFERTTELVELCQRVAGRGNQRINPATQVFQALRIEVNNELGNLLTALGAAVEIVSSGGKIAVISFHSLEDRIVKNVFRALAKEKMAKILTKKPLVASEEEIKINPRSRSGKLRVMERL